MRHSILLKNKYLQEAKNLFDAFKKSIDVTREETENRIVKSSDQGLEVKSKIVDVQAGLVVAVLNAGFVAPNACAALMPD